MVKSKNDETWCSDALHSLLGYTDTALSQYLTSVARTSSSHEPILTLLQEGNVTPQNNSRSSLQEFAVALYQQVHKGNGGGGGRDGGKRRKRATNADWVRHAQTYDLMEGKDTEDTKEQVVTTTMRDVPTVISTGTSQERRTKRKEERKERKRSRTSASSSKSDRRKSEKERKKSRRRAALSSSEEEDEDEPPTSTRRVESKDDRRSSSRKRSRRRSPSPSPSSQEFNELTPEQQAEQERQKDLQERDEFAQRLLSKDAERHQSKQAQQEAAAQSKKDLEERLARGESVVDEAGNLVSLETLRTESRRVYLQKRTEQELELLKRELEAEEELFGEEAGVKLTEKERRDLELKRQILRMAQEKEGQESSQNQQDGFYRLPDEYEDQEGKTKAEKDKALLKSRYVEETKEKSEQQLWEEAQTKKAVIGTGKSGKTKGKEYDLIFEEQIDFIMTEEKKGYDNRTKKGDKRRSHSRRKRDRSEEHDESVSSKEESPKEEEVIPMTKHEKILEGRKKLPVHAYRDDFLAAVKENQVLILVGETGSGKTTQIPQYLHEIGYSELGKIGCTQPRRVAAMSVAARVSTEMNVKLGHEVGYSIRFENCTNDKTVIQYMTDGMLLREFLTEPDLKSYSCLIIDEAHERTLHTDILFGLVKDIVRFRDDLKLIISSATLDAEKFSKYFDDAKMFFVPGRMFPVDIYYTKSPEADYVDASVVTVLQIHISQKLDGDILVFLTGQEEIETAEEILKQRCQVLGSRIPELMICPIYANLPPEQQTKIFEKTPKGARKVVLATNIAETSLTIDGICYVIDTGFNKQNSYNARSGMESLMVLPISQAAANQRAGRAGRTQPGKCFRLFTSFSFENELEPNTTPEIMRTNMCNVVLMLKSLGIDDLLKFDFMDSPPPDTLIRALEQLYALGGLNNHGELTKLGRRMAEFPLDPMLSKSVIAAEKFKCVKEVLSTVSMLSIGSSVFYRPKEKAVHADTARMNFARGGGGDHISLLRCYTEWAESDFSTQWCFENFVQVKSMKRARLIREQITGLCERVEIDPEISSPDDQDVILKAITAGFFYNTVKLGKSGDYQTVKQHRTVYIHPSSVLAKEEDLPKWLVYYELALTSREFMRQVAPIEPSWLIEIAPHFYQESEVEDTRTKKMPKKKK